MKFFEQYDLTLLNENLDEILIYPFMVLTKENDPSDPDDRLIIIGVYAHEDQDRTHNLLEDASEDAKFIARRVKEQAENDDEFIEMLGGRLAESEPD